MRGRRPLSLPAEIQWELLPRLVRGGRIEPVGLDADLPLGVDPETIHQVQRLTLEPGDRPRLVVQEVIAHRAGDLADDLTVVCLDWRGPAS